MRLEPFSRLATVRQLALSALSLALGIAAALALVSCGGSDANLLPGNTAAEITENLDRVQSYAEEGECIGAEDAVAEVSEQVEALEDVDPKLEEALRRGVARLGEVVAECEETSTETVAPATEATTERTAPSGQEKKAEKELEKEEAGHEREEEKAEQKEAAPPETTSEEPATTTPAPSEGGGTGAPGGVSPGAPAETGGE
jgi:hypothetical protein